MKSFFLQFLVKLLKRIVKFDGFVAKLMEKKTEEDKEVMCI